MLITAAIAAPADKAPGWQNLFDGASLKGWTVTDFYKPGAIKVESAFRDGGPALVFEAGTFLTGLTWAKPEPPAKNNYEIELEAMKVEGNDFFCALTFPVRDSACTLVMGGWGGRVTGLSSVDDSDASDNETAQAVDYELNRWYKVRVRVTDAKIEVWIDNKSFIELETKDRKIGLRAGEIEASAPLGIAAYQTKAAFREIRLRKL